MLNQAEQKVDRDKSWTVEEVEKLGFDAERPCHSMSWQVCSAKELAERLIISDRVSIIETVDNPSGSLFRGAVSSREFPDGIEYAFDVKDIRAYSRYPTARRTYLLHLPEENIAVCYIAPEATDPSKGGGRFRSPVTFEEILSGEVDINNTNLPSMLNGLDDPVYKKEDSESSLEDPLAMQLKTVPLHNHFSILKEPFDTQVSILVNTDDSQVFRGNLTAILEQGVNEAARAFSKAIVDISSQDKNQFQTRLMEKHLAVYLICSHMLVLAGKKVDDIKIQPEERLSFSAAREVMEGLRYLARGEHGITELAHGARFALFEELTTRPVVSQVLEAGLSAAKSIFKMDEHKTMELVMRLTDLPWRFFSRLPNSALNSRHRNLINPDVAAELVSELKKQRLAVG